MGHPTQAAAELSNRNVRFASWSIKIDRAGCRDDPIERSQRRPTRTNLWCLTWLHFSDPARPFVETCHLSESTRLSGTYLAPRNGGITIRTPLGDGRISSRSRERSRSRSGGAACRLTPPQCRDRQPGGPMGSPISHYPAQLVAAAARQARAHRADRYLMRTARGLGICIGDS
jgi:hypothetical protein